MGVLEHAIEFAKFFSIYRQNMTLTEYEMLAHEQACNLVQAYFKHGQRALNGIGTHPQQDSSTEQDGKTDSTV